MSTRHHPICPNCCTTMRLGRRIPPFNRQPELQTFECRSCGVVLTEAAPAAARTEAATLQPA